MAKFVSIDVRRVTDTMLHEIFETVGPVVSVKIVTVSAHV